MDNKSLIAKIPDKIGTMGRNEHGPLLTPLEHFLLALALKILIADQDDFVDQIAIKFDRQRQSECKPCPHAGRVGLDGHSELPTQFGEILHELSDFPIVSTINAGQ